MFLNDQTTPIVNKNFLEQKQQMTIIECFYSYHLRCAGPVKYAGSVKYIVLFETAYPKSWTGPWTLDSGLWTLVFFPLKTLPRPPPKKTSISPPKNLYISP